jgi:hypothetical protein
MDVKQKAQIHMKQSCMSMTIMMIKVYDSKVERKQNQKARDFCVDCLLLLETDRERMARVRQAERTRFERCQDNSNKSRRGSVASVGVVRTTVTRAHVGSVILFALVCSGQVMRALSNGDNGVKCGRKASTRTKTV